MAVMAVDVDGPAAVRERLEAFGAEVLAEATNRPVQPANGGLYLRGLSEQGPRKSLEPMVARLGGEADYESLQNFLAVSPWDPSAVVRAVAERVAPAIEIEAWVLDDTGFPKDGPGDPAPDIPDLRIDVAGDRAQQEPQVAEGRDRLAIRRRPTADEVGRIGLALRRRDAPRHPPRKLRTCWGFAESRGSSPGLRQGQPE
jgi:hypothetical protein